MVCALCYRTNYITTRPASSSSSYLTLVLKRVKLDFCFSVRNGLIYLGKLKICRTIIAERGVYVNWHRELDRLKNDLVGFE